MFKITEETSQKYGYAVIDNVKNYTELQGREKALYSSKVELFGRAFKVTVFDEELNQYVVTDVFSTNEDINHMLLIGVDIEGLGTLVSLFEEFFIFDSDTTNFVKDYFAFVTENMDYFDSQYKLEDHHAFENLETMTGIEFEGFCKRLLESMGFEVQQTKASGDGGIDLVAYNHKPLFEGTYIVQCKRYKGSVGEPTIRDLYGVITSERANKGILITTGYFTNSAISFAEGKNIELIDGEKLNKLLNDFGGDLGGDQLYSANGVCQKTIDQIIEDALEFDVLEKMNYLKTYPKEEQMRAKVIERLTDIILNQTVIWVKNKSEKLVVMSEIHKQISLFAKYCDKSNINVRFNNLKWLLDVHTILDIQCHIFESNFYQAFQEYRQLMNRTELFIENMYEDNIELALNYWLRFAIFVITYNIIQISLLFEDKKLTEEMSNIGISYINDVQDSCSFVIEKNNGNEYVIRYYRHMLDTINSINELRGFFIIDDYLIRIANEAAYENGDPDYLPEWRPAEVIDNSLIFYGDCGIFAVPYNKEKEYFRIDEISEVISKNKLLM